MGIRSKIKKRLPIFGRRSTQEQSGSLSSPSSSGYEPGPTLPVEPEVPASPRGGRPVQEFLAEYVKENNVVLFMKGSPSSPLCGFSANAAGILASYGHPFTHFDVIADHDVREGVKDFSQWPTLPQIYLGGEFVGGSDILSQMHESGELGEELKKLFAAE